MAVNGIDDADFFSLEGQILSLHHLRDAQRLVGELPGHVEAVTGAGKEENDTGTVLSGFLWRTSRTHGSQTADSNGCSSSTQAQLFQCFSSVHGYSLFPKNSFNLVSTCSTYSGTK